MSEFFIHNDQAFGTLECQAAFDALTEKEKLYAYYLSKAVYCGSLIIPIQTSLESPLIFNLLYKLFKEESINELKEKATLECQFTSEDFTALLLYVSGFISNYGNYKGFGDVKFIPNLNKEKFESLIFKSNAWKKIDSKKKEEWLEICLEKMFSLAPPERHLGILPFGVTTYLSKNINQEDIKIVNEFMKKHNINPKNSRTFKTEDEMGKLCYEIRLGSILLNEDNEDQNIISDHTVNGFKFVIRRGDYSNILKLVNDHLLEAEKHVSNDLEKQVIENYICYFRTGSIKAHIEAARDWIRNKSPVVETIIGFLETYKDPAGERAKFEGFVAVVNKIMSAKFKTLVDKSADFLPLLPWPKEYENHTLIPPDFTYLEVLSYANSSIPIGKNLPNYKEVRQIDGFKNFFLGNVILARNSGESMKNINSADTELFEKYKNDALQIKVGLHEFLGHGCGKMFEETNNGLNFNENLTELGSDKKINSWYKEGENFDLIFGDIAASYEECRADSVALYMSTYPQILQVFGFEGAEANDILYVIWLEFCLQGLFGLNTYDHETKTWLQAHCRGRLAILRCLLEANSLVKIDEITGEDGKPDLLVSLDRSKLLTTGKETIGKFLIKLQLYKATANATEGKKFYQKYSTVDDSFLRYRDIVKARIIPRKILVLPNTFIKDEKVTLKNYDATPDGIIQSWLERFENVTDMETILLEQWSKDKEFFL